MAHHVIYVPGLGDRMSYGQNIAIQLWRLFGLHPHYFPLGWSKKENFNIKLSRLLERVDALEQAGHLVSLVGASAGASAVLNAYAKHRSIRKVVCISGKINRPESIGPEYYDTNPDFEASVKEAGRSLNTLSAAERRNIMSTHPWRDTLVPAEDTIIEGAKEKTLPGWGHVSGILFALTYGAPVIARFIRTRV